MNNEYDIKLDEFGNVDTAYYINEAHRLRSEYHAAAFTKLVGAVKSLLSFELPKISVGRPAHH